MGEAGKVGGAVAAAGRDQNAGTGAGRGRKELTEEGARYTATVTRAARTARPVTSSTGNLAAGSTSAAASAAATWMPHRRKKIWLCITSGRMVPRNRLKTAEAGSSISESEEQQVDQQM